MWLHCQSLNQGILALREDPGGPVEFLLKKWFGEEVVPGEADEGETADAVNRPLAYGVGGFFGLYFFFIFLRVRCAGVCGMCARALRVCGVRCWRR